jgi:hypothetical protein
MGQNPVHPQVYQILHLRPDADLSIHAAQECPHTTHDKRPHTRQQSPYIYKTCVDFCRVLGHTGNK